MSDYCNKFSAPERTCFTKQDTKAIKGAAILLMLYHHLFAFPKRIATDIIYTPMFTIRGINSAYILGLFGKTCVALFLFLGGYGIYLSYQSNVTNVTTIDKYELTGDFCISKLKSLYKRFWKVFIIMIPVALFFGDSSVSTSLDKLFWNFSGLDITFNREWWFLTPYLILTFCFPLIAQFVNRNHTNPVTDLFIIALFNTFVIYLLPDILNTNLLSNFSHTKAWSRLYTCAEWSPCFIVGCVFARWGIMNEIKNRLSSNFARTFVCALILIIMVPLRYKIHVGMAYDFAFAPVICICLTAVLAPFIGSRIRWVLELIGERSTDIWLIHSFYCYHLCQRLVFAPRFSILIVLWLLILSLLTSIAIDQLFKLLNFALKGLRDDLHC